MGSAGIVLRKLLVCKVWISVRSFDQGPVLVEDEIEDSMLYLHELSKNTRYLVHVLPLGVASARDSYPLVLACGVFHRAYSDVLLVPFVDVFPDYFLDEVGLGWNMGSSGADDFDIICFWFYHVDGL